MNDLRTNYEAGVKVAQGLVGMLHLREFPFDRPNVKSLFPDSTVPEGLISGSRAHMLYQFSACCLDQGMLAEVVYDGMRSFVRTNDITELHKLTKEELVKVLVPHFSSIGHPEKVITTPAETLEYNLKKLQEEYAGDPRLLRGNNIEETMRNIKFGKTGSGKPDKKFKRYGEGTAALLLKNMVRFGVWDFSIYEIPTKIDRHMQRISLGAGVISPVEGITRGRVDSLVRVLTKLYQMICINEKISAIELCDTKWAVGHYRCGMNSDVYCRVSQCPIKCSYRPVLEANKRDKANSRPSYFVAGSEMRHDMHNLFSWAEGKLK